MPALRAHRVHRSAARPLFEAIVTAAHAAGDREALFGPVALLPNQSGGVITSGYADRGFIDSAWNPPRYVTATSRTDSAGGSSRTPGSARSRPATTPARADDRGTDPGTDPDGAELRVHRGDVQRLAEQLELLREMLNASFAQLGYYTEISAAQLRRQTDGLAYLLDESLLLYLTRAGRPVAFVLCVPDISEFVVRVRGNLNLVNQLRLLAVRRRYRREAVLIVKGVLPSTRAADTSGCSPPRCATTCTPAGTHAAQHLRRPRNPASAAQYRAPGGRPLHGYTFYEKAL